MRKLQKAAVAAAILGSFSFIATGTANAYGGHDHGGCKSHDQNIDILGQVGVLNGLLGNALNGEGSAGGQINHTGSSCHH
ncbi:MULTISPECIES: hypothetical protein [unclassified Streptomyces]|uniref:hypothetical protein n=1 Tax=unclassified Streptomyces TaxID=2593676 RepID=UPI00265BD6EB|nr:hypothetical protein [Streptomyces sp. DT2A-34]MDO0913704.1 hypothetical protein [Streptomyces sp. DT2A-34]